MNLNKTIHSFITKHALIPDGSRIILGLSGGPDSLFLLHLLSEMRKSEKISTLIAAHLDHEWRENSALDVTFCKQACDALNVPFVSAKLSEFAPSLSYKGSKEEFARRARRMFFEKLVTEHNATAIALGHHLHDQQETFFIRLIRGASLTGLCSIWPKNDHYIRPLLEITKPEIVAYLDRYRIPYLTDPTNISSEYLRNRIRNDVIPALQACDTRFDGNFLKTITRLQETELYLQDLTQKIFEAIIIDKNPYTINITLFHEQPSTMQYRLLIVWLCAANVPFSPVQSFLDEIIHFLRQPESKTHTIHETWSLIKEKNKIYIKK
jgi:tRNA(Ile)-lysidine synthetase, N-terminal domain